MGTKTAPHRLYRKEAATLIGVAPVTLLEMERRGDGPPVMRIGPRTVRYDRVELSAWMQAKGIKPARPAGRESEP